MKQKDNNVIWAILVMVTLLFFVFVLFAQLHNWKDMNCKNIEDVAQKSYCWENAINGHAKKGEIHKSFEMLQELYAVDSVVALDCHAYAHIIGTEASKAFLRDGRIELSPLSALCGYGFYHGFMESLLAMTGNFNDAKNFCGYADKELLQQGLKGGLFACYHGFGHGILDGSDPRTWGDPQAMLKPALATCSKITENDFLHSRCATGVFNSLEILSQTTKYQLEDSIGKNPFGVCHAQPLLYSEPCYTNMIPAVLRLTKNDIEASAGYVLEHIPRPDDPTTIGSTVLETAILALFNEFMRLYGGDTDYARIGVTLCRALPTDVQPVCIEGLSSGHIKYGVLGEEYPKWLSFCENAMLANDEENVCFAYVLPRLSIWYPSPKKEEICDMSPLMYQKYCKDNEN